MAKRRYGEDIEDESIALVADDTPKKKRKVKDVTVEDGVGKLSNQERKQLKNQKKKEQEPEQEVEVTSTPSGEYELSKEERKQLKKQKRREQQVEETVAPAPPVTEPQTAADELEKKLLRKAEKKRLKELKKQAKANGEELAVPTTATDAQEARENGLANGHTEQHTNGYTVPSGTGYQQDQSLSALPQSKIDEFLASNFITVTQPPNSKPLRPMLHFSHLPNTTKAEQAPFTAFKNPTPIQSAAWPYLLSGKDVIGVAETGSGKTLAFGVPCIRHIASLPSKFKKSGAARAVIVSPTRELAVQIYDQIVVLTKSAGLNAVCVYGGVPKDPQRLALATAQIVVATPGRLNDLVNEGAADLSAVSYMVLDEADRMLDKGFEEEIRKIISATLPNTPSSTTPRQTLMFTATWPESVRTLAATFMREPVRINIGDNPAGELRANTRIEQRVEVVDPRSKETRLLQLIKQHQSGKSKDDRILVFCLYKKEATRVENFLHSKGLRVAGIHGDLSQEKRTASLGSFKKGTTPLLVATDVAARGLDIPAVKLVINVTFPLTVEDYVHRIGRTGRAGANGLAITLFTDHDKAQSGALINVLKAANQPIPEELLKFGTTVKKKAHDAYGAFYKDMSEMKAATKVKFDD